MDKNTFGLYFVSLGLKLSYFVLIMQPLISFTYEHETRTEHLQFYGANGVWPMNPT
jgi:hypothetical protein